MSTVTAPTIPVALPKDLVREIDEVSAETGYPRDELLRAAVRRFALSERRYRNVQQRIQARAEALGLHTEGDIEAFLDADFESESSENQE